MEINQQINNNKANINKHIINFYKTLLGTPRSTFANLKPNFWDENEMILEDKNTWLVASIIEAVIHRAVFESEAQGAIGPDGLSFAFYQFF